MAAAISSCIACKRAPSRRSASLGLHLEVTRAGAASTRMRSAISMASSMRCVINKQVLPSVRISLGTSARSALEVTDRVWLRIQIEQQDLRIDGERAGERHALAHPAGELVRILVLGARHLDAREPVARANANCVFVDAQDLQAERDILSRGAPRQQPVGLEADRELAAQPRKIPVRIVTGQRTVPVSGPIVPMIRFMAVLLPAPVRPTRATISPGATTKLRSCVATVLPNLRVTLTSSISDNRGPNGLPPRLFHFVERRQGARLCRPGQGEFLMWNLFSIF